MFGLPNIPGVIAHIREKGQTQPSGAFQSAGIDYTSEYQRTSALSENPYGWEDVTFSADRANSVYGQSNTVQPPALMTFLLIRY